MIAPHKTQMSDKSAPVQPLSKSPPPVTGIGFPEDVASLLHGPAGNAWESLENLGKGQYQVAIDGFTSLKGKILGNQLLRLLRKLECLKIRFFAG
jgi:hypothetical protein